jgi:hypothetical protein
MAMRCCVCLVVLALANVARADPRQLPVGGPVVVVPPASCWDEPRYFDSLRGGTVDFCRQHLGYHPGRLECVYAADRVCDVYDPETRQWVRTHAITDPGLFPCPDTEPPPVCPRLGAGLGSDGLH